MKYIALVSAIALSLATATATAAVAEDKVQSDPFVSTQSIPVGAVGSIGMAPAIIIGLIVVGAMIHSSDGT